MKSFFRKSWKKLHTIIVLQTVFRNFDTKTLNYTRNFWIMNPYVNPKDSYDSYIGFT